MGRQRIIERERRWAVPAAVAAVLTFAFYVASFIVDRTANLYTGASDAHQLSSLHDHSGTILLSSVVRAIAFLLLPVPILYLFRAAQARNPRVQAAMVAFVFVGPILFAAQGIIQAVGASQAASDFVKLPSEQTRSFKAFQSELKQNPASIDEVTIYTAHKELEVQQGDAFYTVGSYPASAESSLPGELDKAGVSLSTVSDAAAQPGDARATHVTDNSSTLQVSQAILFPAVLGLVVMMIYTPLQAQRVGLLSRFFGSLGMALGASMILILPVALLGVLVWTGYLGLLFVGRAPGGRPPAWEAGEAVPWPRPGDEDAPAGGSSDTAIEGEAAEVPSAGQPSSASQGQSDSARRKRKRRR